MNSHRGEFRLNKQDGKVMGVCAGLSDYFDVDVTLVRVAMVVALLLTFPVAGIAYLVVALVAKSGSRRRARDLHDAPRLSEASIEATRARMRDLDARMQAIETYVTSSNTSLAHEIDSLR